MVIIKFINIKFNSRERFNAVVINILSSIDIKYKVSSLTLN